MATVTMDISEHQEMKERIELLDATLKETKELHKQLERVKEEKSTLIKKIEIEADKKIKEEQRKRIKELEEAKDKIVKKTLITKKQYKVVRKNIDIIYSRFISILKEVEAISGREHIRETPNAFLRKTYYPDPMGDYISPNPNYQETSSPINDMYPYRITEDKIKAMIEEFFDWAFTDSVTEEKNEGTIELIGFKDLKETITEEFMKKLDNKIKKKLEMYDNVVIRKNELAKDVKELKLELKTSENTLKLQKNEHIRLTQENAKLKESLNFCKKEIDSLKEIKIRDKCALNTVINISKIIEKTNMLNKSKTVKDIKLELETYEYNLKNMNLASGFVVRTIKRNGAKI